MSSKNITGEREVITNITVKKSSNGLKSRPTTDIPPSRSKSPIVSRKPSLNTSKVVNRRNGAPLLPASGASKARKKTGERRSSKSASRVVSRSKSKGKKLLNKVQTDQLLMDEGLISQESCSQMHQNQS